MPDIHGTFEEPTPDEVEAMIPRIKAFIFPSIPRTDFEQDAFNRAVYFQINHEKSQANSVNGQQLPNGVNSFSIGDFSMSFGAGTDNGVLTRKTICPTAYGLLLEAGLLYKGVEGRW